MTRTTKLPDLSDIISEFDVNITIPEIDITSEQILQQQLEQLRGLQNDRTYN